MKRQAKEFRPNAISEEAWKNRTRVSCKLKHKTYADFFIYCQKNNFNFNSGVNHLLQTHPELNND